MRASAALTTPSFIAWDNPRSLFPLRTNPVSAFLAGNDLHAHIANEILDPTKRQSAFGQATAGYALKDSLHNRRILVLDPFSTYFMYGFVLDNRRHFGPSIEGSRRRYGYSLPRSGKPSQPIKEYSQFRTQKYALKKGHKYFAQVDIANCFNSFYHHNVATFISQEVSQSAGQHMGQLLREINGGHSVGCFPQGIFPAKTVGNTYLSFAERSGSLKSSAVIRFMDDFFLFDDDERVVLKDIRRLQEVIGEHHLALNSAKTRIGSKADDFEERELSAIKKSLLAKRSAQPMYSDDATEPSPLEPEEAEYLKELIRSPNVAEEDVELALSLLQEDPEEALKLAKLVLEQYPHLVKSLYSQVRHLPDEVPIWTELCARLACTEISEFELFWLIRIALDHFDFDEESARFLFEALEHPSAGTLVEAAVLECRSLDYGLFELKQKYLRERGHGLVGYASAIGLLGHEKAQRNMLYKYAMKNSTSMYVLLSALNGIDPATA